MAYTLLKGVMYNEQRDRHIQKRSSCIFAGAILIGALLGAVTFCYMGSDELSMLSVFSNSFVDVRSSGDLEEILVRSFFSSTVF